MRITPDILMKIAEDTANQRVAETRSLIAAYMTGSALDEEPLLGGTTDIDICLLYDDDREETREIVRITDDVHLDITHSPKEIYRHMRELRSHAWLGPTIFHCKILYDPQHFLDLVQASVRGQFDRPDIVLTRARSQFDMARQIWFDLETQGAPTGLKVLSQYIKALEGAANSISLLSGPPLTERRFLLDFPIRTETVNRSGLYAGLLGLLGAPCVDEGILSAYIEIWHALFDRVQQETYSSTFDLVRRNYYVRAFEVMLASQQPHTVLWPLLNSWVKMLSLVPETLPEYSASKSAFTQLGLLGNIFPEKLVALDSYLDLVDETLEQWAALNGA